MPYFDRSEIYFFNIKGSSYVLFLLIYGEIFKQFLHGEFRRKLIISVWLQNYKFNYTVTIIRPR